MLMVVLACKILLRGSDKAVTIVGHIGRVFLGICSRRVVPAGFVAIDWSLRQRGHDPQVGDGDFSVELSAASNDAH